MTFSLYGEQHAHPRGSLPVWAKAVCFTMLAWLSLACIAPSAAAQLKVRQPLDFGSATVGSPVTLNVVFSAAGTTTVASASVLTDGAAGEDFAPGTATCLGTLQQGTGCELSVTFTPKQIGLRRGVLQLYDAGHNLLSQVVLHGIGMGSAFAFAPANVTSTHLAKGLSPATFTTGAAVLDGYGNLYFTDLQNQRVLQQTPSGALSQIASLPVTATSGIAIAPDGTLFVAAGRAIYAFQPGAKPTPLNTGSVQLVSPSGLAVDSLGDLYIADLSTGLIARYSIQTAQTTTLPLASLTPALSGPKGLAFDAAGNLYIADSGNDRVVQVAATTGTASALAFSGLSLNNPSALAVDPAGTVYVADTGDGRLVERTVSGVSFALTGPNLKLATPTGVLIRPNGDLVLSDTALGQVLVSRSVPSVIFPTPTIVDALDTADGVATLTLQATGNSVAQLLLHTAGTEPAISSSAFAVTPAGSCASIGPGGLCEYTVTFTPTAAGPNSANLELDISLPSSSASGAATYTTLVPLTGMGISATAAFDLTVSPSTTTVGVPVALTLTALNASGGLDTGYNGAVKFFSGTTLLATGMLSGGVATTSVRFATAGTQTLTAVYGGDANTAPVTSSPHPLQVLQPATVTLASSVNPSNVQESIFLTATVASAGPTPTSLVRFLSGTTVIGVAGLNNGTAILYYTFTAAGTDNLTAAYVGDANTAPATSPVLAQVVKNTSAVTLSTSLPAVLIGNPLTLSVTVYSAGVTPTGTVAFYNGTTQLGSATLANGTASLPVSFSQTGYLSLTAVYPGDANTAPNAGGLTELVGDMTFAGAPGLPSSVSVLAGGTAQYSLVLTPLVADPFPSAVSFTVTGLPTGATASFSPATVSAGQSTSLVVLSVTVPALTGELRGRPPLPGGLTRRSAFSVAAAFLLLPLSLLRRRRLSSLRHRLGALLLLLMMAAGTAGLAGCVSAANSGFYGLTPQTYPLTVTATSGQLSRTATVTLTVQ